MVHRHTNTVPKRTISKIALHIIYQGTQKIVKLEKTPKTAVED